LNSSLICLTLLRYCCLSTFSLDSSSLTSSISDLFLLFFDMPLRRKVDLPFSAIVELNMMVTYYWRIERSWEQMRIQVASQLSGFGSSPTSIDAPSELCRPSLKCQACRWYTSHRRATSCQDGTNPSHPADTWGWLGSFLHAWGSHRLLGHQSMARLIPWPSIS